MSRQGYRLFSPARIGRLALPNRLARSATWDPCILAARRMDEATLDLYRRVALGGVGLIITGGLPVAPANLLDEPAGGFADALIEGTAQLAAVVHQARPDCKIVAQVECSNLPAGPSDVDSPFWPAPRPLTPAEIACIVDCFVQVCAQMERWGFDGVQLHAAHGTLLSNFLSPYTNRRDDAYGGSVAGRARIVREIVAGARRLVGDFPILIKMNGVDYLPGGIDLASFPALAAEIAGCGVDAIEVSGGMWDCLARPAAALGFPPVPIAEAHTRIGRPDKQSYFLPYAAALHLDIPVILVGGNRHVERLEEIVQAGKADFIALCRPLLCEPDLPRRWLEGRGRPTPACSACNACVWAIFQPAPGPTRCILQQDRARFDEAQAWLATWVEQNRRG